MAIGDDAVAAGMQLVNGATTPANTLDTEDNRTRDYIAQQVAAERDARIAADNTKVPKPADGAAMARLEPGSSHSVGFYTTADSTLYFRPVSSTSQYDRKVATQQELNAAIASIPPVDISGKRDYGDGYFPGDLNAANLTVRASFAASSGWTAAYIDGSGRLAKGASSIRYKNLLDDPDVSTLGNVFPTLRCYAMKQDEAQKPTLGYIAEELAENPDTERYVVYEFAQDANGEWGPTDRPESIDFIQLLIAQNAVLNSRLTYVEIELSNLRDIVIALIPAPEENPS